MIDRHREQIIHTTKRTSERRKRDLKSRKVLGLGELVIATGADSLRADELAGALIMLAETKEATKPEGMGETRCRVPSEPGAANCTGS
jgi:Conjugal transfer protein TraD